jgi:hypothetical protein
MAQQLISPVHSEFDRNLGTGIGAIFGVSNLVLRSPSAHYFADAVQLNVFTHPWSLGVGEAVLSGIRAAVAGQRPEPEPLLSCCAPAI